MTVEQLKKYKRQLSNGRLDSQSVLQEIGQELLFNPNPDPKYLVELNIFLRELHRTISSGKKEIYTTEMQKVLIMICAKASYIAERVNDRKKGQKFYEDLQVLGQQLLDIAPNLQAIIGLVLMMNPDIKFFI